MIVYKIPLYFLYNNVKIDTLKKSVRYLVYEIYNKFLLWVYT